MASPDTLRYATIPLAHGSGAMPANPGLATLIPDPLAAVQATKIVSRDNDAATPAGPCALWGSRWSPMTQLIA
jgi:hypothetical protein